MFNSPFIIPIAFAFAWVAVTWIRAHHGLSDPAWASYGKSRNMKVPPLFEKMLEKAMEERDAEISALKERVQVLESIVVETHKSKRLADEIDRLA